MGKRRLAIRLLLFGIAIVLTQAETRLDGLSFSLFDSVVTQARDEPNLRGGAFHFLRMVAEGRTDEVSRELLAGFTYRAHHFRPVELAQIRVRARAYEQIGRLATPEAQAYLEAIDLSQFNTVDDQPFAMSIPFGIFLAKAGQIADPQRRWEFYAETLRHPPEGLGRDGPLSASYRGLCSEGALGFLPDVEAYVRRKGARESQEERIQSCKQMMHLVASHSSRVAGLEAALYEDTKVFGKYFRSWAVQELDEMHTKESRAALERFVNDTKTRSGTAPDDSDLRRDLRSAELALVRLAP
jgi:hypothetical protein